MPLSRYLNTRSRRGFALGVAGATAVWLAEQLIPSGLARSAVIDTGWTGAGMGAVVGASRALRASRPADRFPWLCIAVGALSWTVGQLAWNVYEIGGLTTPTPSYADLGRLGAAPLYTIGLIAFLARRGQRLAVFALLLDTGAVVLTLLAGIALVASEVFSSEMVHEPLSAMVGLAYPLLYVAALGAALSALWGMPLSVPRRAFVSLVAGIGLHALAFTLYLPRFIENTFTEGTLLDPLWMLGMLGIGVAGTQWVEDRSVGANTTLSAPLIQFSRMALPGVIAVLAAFFLIASQLDRVVTATAPIIAACVALTTLILATRAGVALFTNWRLGERERRRAEQFEALYQVGLATASEGSLEELVKVVVEDSTQLTRTDGATLALVEPGGGLAVRARKSGALAVPDVVATRGIAREAFETRKMVVASVYREHRYSNPHLHGVISSALAVPLIAAGELVGTLTVYSGTPRRFSEDTQRLAQLYAAQAAIAIANARHLAETRRLARDDDLTGILNRRSLMERLEAEIHEATRHGDVFGVVLCDLDGLKTVNDTAGHIVGNEVLKTVARIMRESARTEDLVARFGGDEFVLLLPRTSPLPAQALVARIASRLREERYHWAGRENEIPRVSFGIALFPGDGRTADAVLGAADARMYEDKARAREGRRSAAEAE